MEVSPFLRLAYKDWLDQRQLPSELAGAIVSRCDLSILPTTARLNSTFRYESERQLYHTVKIYWELGTLRPQLVAQILSAISKPQYVRRFQIYFQSYAEGSDEDVAVAHAVRDALAVFSELQELDIFYNPYQASPLPIWMPVLEQWVSSSLFRPQDQSDICRQCYHALRSLSLVIDYPNHSCMLSLLSSFPGLEQVVLIGDRPFEHTETDLGLIFAMPTSTILACLWSEGGGLTHVTMYPAFTSKWSSQQVKKAVQSWSTSTGIFMNTDRIHGATIFISKAAELESIIIGISETFPAISDIRVHIQEAWASILSFLCLTVLIIVSTDSRWHMSRHWKSLGQSCVYLV